MPVQSGDIAEEQPGFEQLYDELRRIAGSLFSEQGGGHTLQPTAVINEAWLKLRDHTDQVTDRVHFLALAARAMRQVLADHARAKGRLKRGGSGVRVGDSAHRAAGPEAAYDMIDLHEALTELGELNERHARVAELRVLGCLTVAEIAGLLDVSEPTVKRDWAVARLWLAERLDPVR